VPTTQADDRENKGYSSQLDEIMDVSAKYIALACFSLKNSLFFKNKVLLMKISAHRLYRTLQVEGAFLFMI
jgi:hypothetical protein